MSNIADLDKDLNEKILTGKALEAFDQYYADDVVMQENSDAPFVGKEFNRKREIEFFSSIAEWHGGSVEATAVNGDTSFGQWSMDVTFKNGYRAAMNQVAVRKWKDGKIIHERFFYNKG
jgi:ketosteroid isomerase-like protein